MISKAGRPVFVEYCLALRAERVAPKRRQEDGRASTKAPFARRALAQGQGVAKQRVHGVVVTLVQAGE